MTLRSISFFHFEFWLFFKTPKKLRFTTLSLKILNTSELHWALKHLQPLSLLLFKLNLYMLFPQHTKRSMQRFFQNSNKKGEYISWRGTFFSTFINCYRIYWFLNISMLLIYLSLTYIYDIAIFGIPISVSVKPQKSFVFLL